jgi:hypothetical protein
MKTRIDEIYEDIAGRTRANHRLFTKEIMKNIKILSEIIKTVNLAKCTLYDLDSETPNATGYLMYKLQKEYNIPFGICGNCEFLSTKNNIQIKCKRYDNISCLGLEKVCPLKKKKITYI